jgi:hypothetical protein
MVNLLLLMNKTFGLSVVGFFNSLDAPEQIDEVKIINPYKEKEVQRVVKDFYIRFFNDQNSRTFIIGINPGRLGGGLTGISFTDPVALRGFCGIENHCGEKRELSSKFIYTVIQAFGGVESFYSKFYLTALYPLALTKDDKNFNYYDTPTLQKALEKDMVSSLKHQIGFGAIRKKAICLGKKNFAVIEKLNKQHHFFDELSVLEHPRYIMQYKLKQIDQYVEHYLKVMKE